MSLVLQYRTVAYLNELKELARRSRRSFEDILRAELARGESVERGAEANITETPAEPEPLSPPHEPQVTAPAPLLLKMQGQCHPPSFLSRL